MTLGQPILREFEPEVRVILKADAQGTLEALSNAVGKLSTDDFVVDIVHEGVGDITEGDVNLAIAARALLLGFNVRSRGNPVRLAADNGVDVFLFTLIDDAIGFVATRAPRARA
jgi:translation initiation factor IF-2